MTDILTTRAAPRVARSTGRWPLVADLARVHAVRMIRHPILLLSVVWFVAISGIGQPGTPYEQYSAVTGLIVFLVGPAAFFAANLVASAGRRSGVDEWSPSLPLPPVHRTTALLLACLAPAAAAGIANLAMYLVVHINGAAMPVAWQHVATVPVVVFGGAVLGVAVAQLLPWPGTPLVVMAGLVTFNAWASSGPEHLGFYVDFAVWTDNDTIPSLHPGSPSWHLTYLVALCGLAASGALLRNVRRTWVPFACGAAFGTGVLVAGTLQLA